MKKAYLSLTIVILALSLNSCVTGVLLIGGAALVAGGTVYYLNGNYIIEIPHSIRDTYNATVKVFQKNSYLELKTKNFSDEQASVEGESTSEGKSISVDLKKLGDDLTEIKIRYGALGDEDMSKKLADQITKAIN